jgi:hypothetical protein
VGKGARLTWRRAFLLLVLGLLIGTIVATLS